MSKSDAYNEEISSQIPALQLLIALGYQNLTPAASLAVRGGKERNVILTDILEERLPALNGIRFKGQQGPFPTATAARLCAA